MYESKYLLNIDDFYKRHPELGEEVQGLMKGDMINSDFDMFAFIMSYIFM